MTERLTQTYWPVWLALLLVASAIGRTARAADPLPSSHQTLDIVSASYIPGVAAGQRLTPAAPNVTPAVDCVNQCPPGYQATWKALSPLVEFEQWAQGEYVGRSRLPHVPVYRLRVDDQLEFDFRVDRTRVPSQYRINVGDELSVESSTNSEFNRPVIVLPDGTITLPLLGRVPASGLTLAELRGNLEKALEAHFTTPSVSVLPRRINTKLEELRNTISGQVGFARQAFAARITPEGTVQLPAVGTVPAQGLTLDEFKLELSERYAVEVQGMEVVPVLQQHGPRYVYVLGEVSQPGRYTLEAPTTVMQAISMAGSWTVGAHIDNIVVFRRGDDWRLMATKLNLTRALLGKEPCPDAEIWVSDADLIIVPKSKLLRTTDFIDLVFTRGVYGVVPVSGTFSLFMFSNAIPPFLFPLP